MPRIKHSDHDSEVSKPPDDDARLVAMAVRDSNAFATLYRQYMDRVYWCCFQRMDTKEAAEDATSLVFAKALAALPQQQPDCSFRAWLFPIAHHVVADRYRSRRPTEPIEAAAEVADACPAPEERALAKETAVEVHTLIRQLPADQRRILVLRLAGLSGAEVAAVLGRSPGAIKIAVLQWEACTSITKVTSSTMPPPLAVFSDDYFRRMASVGTSSLPHQNSNGLHSP